MSNFFVWFHSLRGLCCISCFVACCARLLNIFILTMSQTNVCCHYQSLLIVIYPQTFQFLWASWTLLASFRQSFWISENSENLINIGLLCIWRLRHNSIYNDAFCLLNMYISWWCVHYDNTSTFFNSLNKWLTNAALMCINHAKFKTIEICFLCKPSLCFYKD